MEKPTASVSGMNSERTGSFKMNVGMNTDRMQSMAKQAGRGRGRAGPPRRPGHGVGVEHLGMGVFDGDHGLVHEDADGQRQAAQRHDVERVAREPQADQGGGQGAGNAHQHHDHAAQVAEKEQDHQPRQPGPDQRPRWPRS